MPCATMAAAANFTSLLFINLTFLSGCFTFGNVAPDAIR